MSPPPSGVFDNSGARDFSTVVDIIATPDKTLEETIGEVGIQKTIIDDGVPNMTDGIDQRMDWVRDQYAIYEDLIFNFENSLSFAIARLTQINELHQGPYFTKARAYACYDDVMLYVYKFDTDYIIAQVNAQDTDPARPAARPPGGRPADDGAACPRAGPDRAADHCPRPAT